MKTTNYSKNFSKPDERRTFKAHGYLDLLTFGDGTSMGKGVFEPGWKWSNDVKPLAGTSSCEAAHVGYCIKGSMVVRMNSGEEFRISAGDAIDIPPGHDAWVDGNEGCELLDFTGFKNYAVGKKAA